MPTAPPRAPAMGKALRASTASVGNLNRRVGGLGSSLGDREASVNRHSDDSGFFQSEESFQEGRLPSKLAGTSPVWEGLLAFELDIVREAWLGSMDHMLSLAGPRMQALQHEASSKAAAEVSKLRSENDSLRSRLAISESTPMMPNQNGISPPSNPKPPQHVATAPQDDAPLLDVPGSVNEEEHEGDSSPLGTPRLNKVLGRDSNESFDRERSKRASTFNGGGRIARPENGGRCVFPDAEAMKEKVRLAIAKKEYNVHEFYWETGVSQAVARHIWFEYSTLAVILFNALWISIDNDHNKEALLKNAHPVFQIAEHGFCAYFTFEWLLRFAAFKVKRHGLKDSWFVFDAILLLAMVSETWALSIYVTVTSDGTGSDAGLGNTSVLKLVRLVRLARMARMAKLLRALPELLILIKGIIVALRSVFFTLVLLSLVLYFFAITFCQVTADTELGDMYFESVPAAMSALFLEGVLPDQASFIKDVSDEHWILGFMVLLFILLASLTVMNMLLGVLVETVGVVSTVEKEQLTVTYVKQRLMMMFSSNNESISRSDFHHILTTPEAAKIIQDLGVDVATLVDFEDFIFESDDELSFGDFMELILQLRGTNGCTVKDIVDLRKSIQKDVRHVEAKLVDIMDRLTQRFEKSEKSMALSTSFSSFQGVPSWKPSAQALLEPRAIDENIEESDEDIMPMQESNSQLQAQDARMNYARWAGPPAAGPSLYSQLKGRPPQQVVRFENARMDYAGVEETEPNVPIDNVFTMRAAPSPLRSEPAPRLPPFSPCMQDPESEPGPPLPPFSPCMQDPESEPGPRLPPFSPCMYANDGSKGREAATIPLWEPPNSDGQDIQQGVQDEALRQEEEEDMEGALDNDGDVRTQAQMPEAPAHRELRVGRTM